MTVIGKCQGGLANSPSFVYMPSAWTIRIVFLFPIAYSRRSVIQKKSQLHLTASLLWYPNKKTFIRWVQMPRRFGQFDVTASLLASFTRGK